MRNLDLLVMVRATIDNTFNKVQLQELKPEVIFKEHNSRLDEIGRLVKLENNRKILMKQNKLINDSRLNHKSKGHYDLLRNEVIRVRAALPSAMNFM